MGVFSRLETLAEWLCYLNDLAVGENAASTCFSRETAEGAGMPPSRLGGIIEMTSHADAGEKRESTPMNAYLRGYNKNTPTPELNVLKPFQIKFRNQGRISILL
jgi:hypothetical protein